MQITDIFKQIERNPSRFPRTTAVFHKIVGEIIEIWRLSVSGASKTRVHAGGIGWFGKQYLAGGNIVGSEQSPISYTIKYEASSGLAYDYAQVVEEGREAYDIVKGLLAKSRKVRVTSVRKNSKGEVVGGGIRYLVVPLPSKGEHEQEASFEMKITGNYQDENNVARNKYSYTKFKNVARNNTAKFTQKIKGGKTQSTKANLVRITDNSSWRQYPKIGGLKITQKMQRVADAKVNAASKRILAALNADIKENWI